MAENIGSVKKTTNTGHRLDEDCWESIFKRLEYNHDIATVSLVCKNFLCITNQMRLRLRVSNLTSHLLPKLLKRFHQLKSIEIVSWSPDVCNDIISKISRSRPKHFEALEVPYLQKFPREALRELAMNMTGLKQLELPQLWSCCGDDIIQLACLFSTLEELSISGFPHLTDRGLEVLASQHTRLKKIRISCFGVITDKSIVSIASNCVNLTDFEVCYCPRVTEYGIGFLLRHCSRLTSLSVKLSGKPSSNAEYRFTIANSIPYARNLEDISFREMFVADEALGSIAKFCPKVKTIYINALNDDSFTTQGVTLLLKGGISSLRDFTFGTSRNTDMFMLEISQHICGLTQLNLSLCHKLSDDTFFILTKTCTSLKSLKIRISENKTCQNRKVDPHHNYQLEELTLDGSVLRKDTLVSILSVSPNLRRLSIKWCCFSKRFMNERIMECLKMCPKLWYLDVTRVNGLNFMGPNEESKLKLKCIKSGETHINDEGLEAIGKMCPDLEKLDIVGCKLVTSHGLKLLVSKCEKLREINMIECPNLSIDLLELVKSRPSLNKIVAPSHFIQDEEQRNFLLRKGCHVTEKYASG